MVNLEKSRRRLDTPCPGPHPQRRPVNAEHSLGQGGGYAKRLARWLISPLRAPDAPGARIPTQISHPMIRAGRGFTWPIGSSWLNKPENRGLAIDSGIGTMRPPRATWLLYSSS